MIRTLAFVLLMISSAITVIGQPADVVQEYINTYRQLAIDEMQRSGVPASITLAQGIHETEAGRSELVLKSNNHFGIKCKSSWTGDKVYHDDDASGECFRSYSSPADSYRDHSDFLRGSDRYSFLFRLSPTDYKGWAYGLKKAGYATNIKYSQILIKLIETYNLQQYTLIAMGKLPALPEMASIQSEGQPAASASQPIAAAPVNYPEGIFQINDTRVIFVRGGTSLLAVADANGLTLSRLLEFNDMTQGEGDILAEDQLIYLQRKRKTGLNSVHQVQPEETLYDIAQSEGIRYESILELNHLEAGMEPGVGEKIYLKEKAPARPALAGAIVVQSGPAPSPESPAATRSAKTRHVVKHHETLSGISRKYGVSVGQIKAWNNLKTTSIKAGQELIIYTD
jgi:LysM repeat protein